MLQLNDVVRYQNGLWRVDFVNDCRAKIIPLAKRVVEILDDAGEVVKSYEAQRKGVNISPNSILEVVADPERAKDELDLELAEAELRREQVRVAKAARQTPVASRDQAVPAPKAPPPRPVPGPQAPRGGGGWEVGGTTEPALRAGSQGAQVYDYVTTHPGATMGDLLAALPGVANLPQCLSKLKLTGYLKRV